MTQREIKRRRKRYGTKTLLVLEVLKGGAFCIADLLAQTYVGSVKIGRMNTSRFAGNMMPKKKFYFDRNTKIGLYKTLYSLEQQGLVERAGNGVWSITKDGKDSVQATHDLSDRKKYICENSGRYTIVAFDIPEKIKTKREWLREALVNMGFSLLQQSVWIAKKKIPSDFVKDLHNMNIAKFVHIFEVTKHGTI
ncbi:hypothetical protein C4565_02120 [Candidatus Parcubacteria bacterium]|nr:MAG: hypothetical protein C4565_02120 [Candidatus Parcubacteria bacterium]